MGESVVGARLPAFPLPLSVYRITVYRTYFLKLEMEMQTALCKGNLHPNSQCVGLTWKTVIRLTVHGSGKAARSVLTTDYRLPTTKPSAFPRLTQKALPLSQQGFFVRRDYSQAGSMVPLYFSAMNFLTDSDW